MPEQITDDLTGETDARRWAERFALVRQNLLTGPEHRDIADDEGAMLGWFANAIEAGRMAGAEKEPDGVDSESPPDGEWAEVEVMGHDSHIGWVTDGTRAGVAVMVIRDWDSRVIAEVPGHALYRFIPLATPLKRPEPRLSITASAPVYDAWNTIGDDDDDPF